MSNAANHQELEKTGKWDVTVTVDATMSTIVRGVEAATPEEAGDAALLDRDLLLQQEWELDEANFDNWILNAYLPDPEDGIFPHEPAEPVSGAKKLLVSSASQSYSEATGEVVDLDGYKGSDGLARFLSAEIKDVLKRESDSLAKERLLETLQAIMNDLDIVYAGIAET